MKPTETDAVFDRSVNIARRVLPFLGEKFIPATPHNYMIFYLYFEGDSTSVKQVVEKHLSSGEPWDDATTAQIFHQLFGAEVNLAWLKSNERLASQIKEMAEGIREETSATAELASKTSRRIDKSLKKVGQFNSLQEAAAFLKSAINEVSQVKDFSNTLSKTLKGKSAEISEVLEAIDEVEVMALTDALTQLANRRAWDDRLEQEFERFQRTGLAAGIIMADIDDFKAINDNYGHLVGDQALKAVARVLKAGLRGIDMAARFGGEEFTCLLPDTEEEGGAVVAERIRRALLTTKFTVYAKPVKITASFGVSQFLPEDETPHLAVERADRAVYLAKSKGKNQVCRFTEDGQPG